ncbi:MAG TPA: hypothetical protein VE377_18725 [Candidatus Dormibacteraeota bacterium]|nr:hypothetical protein [Candidatus Dormibacteraeota bacterium]
MKTQALGWLAAGVLAAGLNSSYQNGGMQWAHRIADRVEYRTSAVLALATGRADRFLTAEQSMSSDSETLPSQCQLRTALVKIQTSMTGAHSEFDRFEAMTARQEAQLARLEANRARMEAQLVRVRIPAVNINPVVVRVPNVNVCPRVRVNVPRVPRVTIPSVPVVHVEYSGPGPV